MKTFVFSSMSCVRSPLFLVGFAIYWFIVQTTRATPTDELRTLKKMDGIMLENIEYRQANIVDVIHDLSELAREYDTSETDPRDRGINFYLDIASVANDDDPWKLDTGNIEDIPLITIKARYVSLKTALDEIMEKTGLEYWVVGNLVKISRKTAPNLEEGASAHPLLSAESIQVVSSFDIKKVRNPAKWKWYCYEPGKAVLSSRPVETSKLGFKREPNDGPVVLLFDFGSGTLYWKWRAAPPAKLFADKDAVNLGDICFGPDPLVERVWCRLNPEWDHRFKISSRLLSTEVYGGDVTLLEKAMEWIQDEWVDQKSPELQELLNDLDEKERRLERIDWRLKEIDRELNQLDKKIEMARNSESRNKGRIEYTSGGMFSESKRLQKDRSELTSERLKLQQEQMDLFTVKRQTNRKIENLMASYKKSKEKEPLEAAVRKMEFTVSVVMKGKERK